MRFAGKRLLTGLIFASLIMPAIVVIIPDYVIANSLGWLNTYQVQIVPWGASTFGIFLLRQAFLGLPSDLYDAARIDGCSRRFYLWSIGVPLVRPALTTVALYIFLGSYNSLLWPLVMTSSNGTDAGVQPIEVGVYSFIGENGTAFNQLCAAVVFTMLPVITDLSAAAAAVRGGRDALGTQRMTTITVLAGERTIGGTQIVVEDGGARLLFDCGLVVRPRR